MNERLKFTTIKNKSIIYSKPLEQNYQISLLNLEDDKNVLEYKKVINTFTNKNVYYSLEHMLPFDKDYGNLKCFLFKKKDVGIILMPFIFRSITNDKINNKYFDVITPWGYGGPVYNDSITEDDIVAFWKHVDGWYKDNNVITEFIRFSLNENHKYYSGTTINTLSNVKGILFDDFEEHWTAFNPKVRNNYRKAVKNDLKFKIFRKENITKKEIRIFNKIYESTMLRNNATSTHFYSDSHFENLILKNHNDFSIAIVYFDNIAISVELIIHENDTLYAFLGGTNADYFSYRPNDFLRVEVIKWAIQQKNKYYILGGGITNDDGLHKSKKAFFPKGEPVFFYTGRKVINEIVNEQICLITNKEKYANLDKSKPKDYFFPFYRFN